MTLKYYGQLKGEKRNTRVAAIEWSDGNKKDAALAERIIDLMIKTTGWKFGGGFDDMIMVDVDDRADFEDFKAFYNDAKRMFKDCEKYGF